MRCSPRRPRPDPNAEPPAGPLGASKPTPAAPRSTPLAAAATPNAPSGAPPATYPPAGNRGPDALRTHRRLTLPPHRATSEVLAGAYPFLAEAGLGTDGLLIGADAWSGASFCFDPWVLYERGVLTNPNMLLAGVIGRGKSCLAKSLATRSIAFGRKVYVPGDPKGEWSAVSRAVGGQAIELGGGLPTRLNPLDEGPRVDSLRRRRLASDRARPSPRPAAQHRRGRPRPRPPPGRDHRPARRPGHHRARATPPRRCRRS